MLQRPNIFLPLPTYFLVLSYFTTLFLLTSPTLYAAEDSTKEAREMAKKAVTTLTKAPALLSGEAIVYPDSSITEKHEGHVKVRIEIDKYGHVKRVEVLKSSGFQELDDAALAGITTFVFSPAEFDNKASAVAIEYQQDFYLDRLDLQKNSTEKTREEDPKASTSKKSTQDVTDRFQEQTSTTYSADLENNLKQSKKHQNINTLNSSSKQTQKKYKKVLNFEGVVRKAGSNTALENVEITAEVVLNEKLLEQLKSPPTAEEQEMGFRLYTTYSDQNGHYAFYNLPIGKHRFSFATTGYDASFIDEEIKENERTSSIVYLKKITNNVLETVVREKRAQKEVSKITLSREEVRKIPGTFGDPLRVIENLPGLARAPFAGGALLVRGANPADSGIYFDGVPIPIIYHFGGLKSVVNAEFLEDLSFYPGGFGSYYGRATAGIVDVQSRTLKMKDFHGFTDISIIDSSFYFAAPIKLKNIPKFTIAAAARRSYLDALLPIVLDAIPGANGTIATPVYWDYQLKAAISPWNGQHFSLFVFGSNDRLKVVGSQNNASFNIGANQGFHRLVFSWKSALSKQFKHLFQPYIGFNTTDVQGSFGDRNAQLGLGTYNWGLRDELTWTINDGLKLSFGLDYIGQTYGLSASIPIPNEIVAFPRVNTHQAEENTSIKFNGFSHSVGLYAEAVYEPFATFKIVPGLRLEYTSFLYEEQEDDSTEKVLQNSPMRWSTDPRITFRYSPLQSSTIKGAAGIYRQNPTGNQLNPLSGNANLVMPRALQVIGGFEQKLSRHVNLDVQAYATFRDLLIQSTSELKTLGGGEFSPVNLNNGGLGHTYGVELLLRHEIGKYSLVFARDLYKSWLPPEIQPYVDPLFTEMSAFGWVAYTLSRTEIDTNDRKEQFILSNFDQTHILTIVGQLNLPLDFSVGMRFRLVSGNPTTLPVGSVHDLDTTNYRRLSQPPQSSRLPAFHQLDLRIDRTFIFDNFKLTPYLDLLNVYNQANAESWQNDYRYNKQEALTGLPILPNFGIQGEF